MLLTINGKDIKIKFGVRFLREMDKLYTIQQEGIALGFGIEYATIQLKRDDRTAMVDILQTAIKTTGGDYRPDTASIENFIDELDDEAYKDFEKEVTNELLESNSTKKRFGEFWNKTIPK